MIHSGLEALKGHWDKEEYAAGIGRVLLPPPTLKGLITVGALVGKMLIQNCWNWPATITPSQRAGKTTIPIHGVCSSMLAAMHE